MRAFVAGELRKGADLIRELDDEDFDAKAGGVGAHFRHNLDFVNGFLRGVTEGKVDYAARDRDEIVETDRRYARRKLERAATELAGSDLRLNEEILVRSEVEHSVWHGSTVGRELEFLLSHTVHHYALIAEKLKLKGVPIDKEFGVAPSTLEYWKSRDEKASAERGFSKAGQVR